jgi:hypothetical protein
MRKVIIIIILFSFLASAANAQFWKLRRYEATAAIGTTQFYGDIGGFSKGKNLLGIKDFSFRQTRFNITAGFKYRILEDVSVRLNFVFGYFHSTDVRGSNESRNFESRTIFFEPSLLGEYYFIKNKGESSFLIMKGENTAFQSILSSFDFYGFTGFGGLSFKVSPNDILSHLTTKTSGFTPVIPIGAGINMFFSSHISFGIELCGRFTFSDDIDGYTSPYSKSNDVYHFLNFTFTYKINTGENGLPSFR